MDVCLAAAQAKGLEWGEALGKQRIFGQAIGMQLKSEPFVEADCAKLVGVARPWTKRQPFERVMDLLVRGEQFAEGDVLGRIFARLDLFRLIRAAERLCQDHDRTKHDSRNSKSASQVCHIVQNVALLDFLTQRTV